MERLREHPSPGWHDLDDLVAAEFDAFETGRSRRRPPQSDASAAADARPLPWEEEEVETEPDDEEAFIERTAAWLRGRADAEALLEAVRTALAEPAPAPTDRPAEAAPSTDADPGDSPEAPPDEAAA
jgi:hypothetical protein